ncbi:MAG: ubiquinol oxidase subunit II [Rhodanobacteraceae bacterium]
MRALCNPDGLGTHVFEVVKRPLAFLQRGSIALSLLGCSGCSTLSHGFLNPAGPVAGGQRELFLIALGLTLLVITPVFVLTPWLVWRYRRGNDAASYKPDWTFSWPLEIMAWGVPIVVVSVLGIFLWSSTHRLDPYQPLASDRKPLQVQVVGLDWKWLFIYPQQGVASLNQLVLPVGRPVHLTLTTDTVMQSLLIPHLGGQVYAMAGMRTQLSLQADHAGSYLGENTQYNGRGFQQQKFRALAMSGSDFAQWLHRARHSGKSLGCARYKQLTRREPAAGVQLYATVQAHLFDWIVDKYRQHLLPGCGAAPGDPAHA